MQHSSPFLKKLSELQSPLLKEESPANSVGNGHIAGGGYGGPSDIAIRKPGLAEVLRRNAAVFAGIRNAAK